MSPWDRRAAHTLSGLLRCGGCGGGMQVATTGPKMNVKQHRCSRHARTKDCPAPTTVLLDKAERLVRAWLADQAGDLETATAAAAALIEVRTAVRQDRQHWDRLREKHERQLVQLNLDRAEGLMPDTVAFVAARDEVTAARDRAVAQLQALGDQDDMLSADHRVQVRALTEQWDEFDVQGRRDALRQLIRQVTVRRLDDASGLPKFDIQPVWERERDAQP